MNWLTLRALDAVFPGNERCPGLAASKTGPKVLTQIRREAPFEMRLILGLAVWVWLLTPIATLGVPLPAVWLPRAWRDRHTERITTTRFYLVRQVALVLKQIGAMVWGQDPDVRRAQGLAPYAGDPGTWKGMP